MNKNLTYPPNKKPENSHRPAIFILQIVHIVKNETSKMAPACNHTFNYALKTGNLNKPRNAALSESAPAYLEYFS